MLTKIITFSCFLAASMAAPTADAEADPSLLAAYHHTPALLPAPAPVAVPAPNCKIEYEEIETQVCTPKTDTVCETKDVIAQHVEYEKICKEVTSTHCATPAVHAIGKRDAEADPFYGLGGIPAAVAAPYHIATAQEETITHPCHEVTSEHCLNSPVVKDTAVPVEQCHVVTKVACVPEVQKIAKTVCEPVKTTAVNHVVNPFAYAIGK